MYRGLLICSDPALRVQLAGNLNGIPAFELAGVLSACASPDELLENIASRKISLLVLCAADPAALALVPEIDKQLQGLPVITIGTREDPDLLLKLMRFGVREHLIAPVDRKLLVAAIDAERERARKYAESKTRFSELYSFLPSRPGVGSSTIAVNASSAMAEEFGARTLLLDCDLWAGTIRFLLGLEDGATLADVMERASDLDYEMWRHSVSHFGKLDVLHAGDLEPVAEPDPQVLHAVLASACTEYDFVCADLPSSLDPFTMEALKQSTRIFLVTTPEVVVLHMAAARVRRLGEMGLGNRLHLVLNRKTTGKIQDKDVEELVGIPVAHSLTNDYAAVQNAIMGASAIAQRSDLGQNIVKLARSLAPEVEGKRETPPPRRKFIEFFHVPRSSQNLILRD